MEYEFNQSISRPGRPSVPYPTSPRMPEPPFKPTSSLRHRRQSSRVMSTELEMSPSSYGGGVGWPGNFDVGEARTSGDAMSVEGGNEENIGNTDDEELAKIAQAMTLLSLHPTQVSSGVHQFPSAAPKYRSEPPNGLAPWPPPEELLKESLRRSLSALHALGRIKSLVPNSEEVEEEVEGKGKIAQIMGFYDRAVDEMRAAGEILNWAQQDLSEEKKVVRERLLKG